MSSEFEKLRSGRPRDINLCMAIGATSGTATLFEGPEHDRGASTLRSDIVASHGTDADSFTAVEVPLCTLADLVEEYVDCPVDFLKVDVEGLEYDVIAGADFSRFRPRVLVVEATYPNTTKPSHESWEPLLLAAGYKFAMFDGLNRFYAIEGESDLMEALSIPANVLDHFVSYRWLAEFEEARDYADNLRSQLESAQESLRTTRAEVVRLDAELAQALVECGKWETEAWRTNKVARYTQDEARMFAERAAVLQDELGVSQLRTARALADVIESQKQERKAQARSLEVYGEFEDALKQAEAAQEELAQIRPAYEQARETIAALHNTRTFRYTARARAGYGAFRQALRLSRR